MLAADGWAARVILEGSAAEAKESGAEATPRPGLVSLDLFDRAIAGGGNSANAYLGRGAHRLETGETKKAIADLTRAIERDEGLAGAFLYRGLAYEKGGQFENARSDYLRAQILDPEGAVGIAAGWNLDFLQRKPTGDQAVVVEELGLPDAFSITVSAPSAESTLYARIEMWEYRRLGRSFSFLDGRLLGEDQIPVDDTANIYPTYRPYQFLTGMLFDDLPEILAQDDFLYLDLPGELMQDGELVFTTQLALGFKQGGLFYVRTIPLPLDRPGGQEEVGR